jgi:hypothetical protein
VVTRHAQHGSRHADTDAGLVHHVEHALQSLAGLADEVAHRAGFTFDRVLAFAEIQQRVGGAAPAALVVQARERHVVAFTGQLAFGVHQFLGHDEQRDASDAGDELALGIRDLGQHEVDDVLGQLVFAGRDPHLVALEAVARAERVALKAIAVRQRPRHHVAERRTGLRFAQTHRS